MTIIFRVSNDKILKLKYTWATESDPVSRQNGTQKAALHRVSLAYCLKFVCVATTKEPDKSSVSGKGFTLAQNSRLQSFTAGKSQHKA